MAVRVCEPEVGAVMVVLAVAGSAELTVTDATLVPSMAKLTVPVGAEVP